MINKKPGFNILYSTFLMYHTETYHTDSMMMIHQESKHVGVYIVFNIN